MQDNIMLRIAVVGSGKIGEMICNFLIDSGDYHVTLIDASEKQLDIIPDCPGLRTLIDIKFPTSSWT